jgi:general stress protein YciG
LSALICPTSVAIERRRMGGKSRAKNLSAKRLSEIGRMGGRPKTASPEKRLPAG